MLKTLDAFHLVTAITIRDRRAAELLFATHDSQQATAARALGLQVTYLHRLIRNLAVKPE